MLDCVTDAVESIHMREIGPVELTLGGRLSYDVNYRYARARQVAHQLQRTCMHWCGSEWENCVID
jgi:hypothetical protein